MSPELKATISGAAEIMRSRRERRVRPLHLLAGALAQKSNAGVQMLREAGITQEKVLQSLGGGEPL
jgi:hypothetical protein